MNCDYVEDLLPLYVGRDLDEKQATTIANHLQSCGTCADSAAEFRKSLELMQQFEPPQFSEDVYAGIRQRVLREIEQKPAARTLRQLVTNIFQPGIRWAVATALLLAVTLSAFYFVGNRNNFPPQVAEGRSATDLNPKSNESTARARDDEPRISSPTASTGGSQIRIHSPRRRRGPGSTDGATTLAIRTLDPSATTIEVSPEANNLTDPDSVALRAPAAPEKTLRVEMQTKNPNIRIIWFSTQRTKRDSPNKSTKRNLEVRTNA